ncbi:hypothetical protein GUITHDRAFT_106700 [Guillardia theta CCMP2712]|uniref:Uncharacterized protein n=1 Tax=Guillardia theta (strain CCMP2712) TaxID=905079 RepID=L1JG00_GUITC|nr:hypothetical protein GUITHDRAFT_106700 [Guillardia theta CCMP2712]EKX47247.1 hypothetical protein GUITHDRAFT_106700 [Guillardia theta CCMP2712]|eukprot:XP_005834227.1 hypothetical protein GUITHDRAFT_106700 [Guillardia theta CCMP2712]
MIPGAVAGAVFNVFAVTRVELLAKEILLIAIMVSVAASIFSLIFIEKPCSPPSTEESASTNAPALSSIVTMLKDYNFLILLFVFTLDGYGWGLILVTSILSDIGYGQTGSLIAQLGLTFSLAPKMFSSIAFCFFWVGFFTSAAAPILLELVAEVTYPQPEIYSAGVCLTVFGVSTFGFVQLSQVMAVSGMAGYINFLWLQNVLFFVSVVLVLFSFKANLKRTNRALDRSQVQGGILSDPVGEGFEQPLSP